jgi:hypothetical protein
MIGLFEQLKAEHREMIETINQIMRRGDENGLLMKKLSKDLDVHMEGEEKYFYYDLKEFMELQELIVEAYDEHEIAERALRKLKWLNYGDVGFEARIRLLKALLENHIRVEEDVIFKEAEKIVSPEQFEDIEEHYLDFRERKIGSSLW